MSHEPNSPVDVASAPGEDSSNVHQTVHDSEDDGTLVKTVLEALENASGLPIDEMSVRLYDSIDPDALDAIFAPTRNGPGRDRGYVSFSVGEFAVTVHADGRVFVRQLG